MVYWKKKSLTAEEFYSVLVKFMSESNHALMELISDVANAVDVQVDQGPPWNTQNEAIMINLWITTFALKDIEGGENEAQRVHQNHIKECCDQIDDESDRCELRRQIQNTHRERFKLYFDLWDSDSAGNQSTLVLSMLQYLFNEGQADSRLMSSLATFPLNDYVLSRMLVITEAIGSYEVGD